MTSHSSDSSPVLEAKPTLPEILLAGGAHLSSFVAPFLAPLIIWLITRKWLPYVGRHAWRALITHLLTLLAIGVFGTLAIIVFVLFLDGTISVPPSGGGLELVYFILFVVLVAAALLAWVVGEVSCVVSAIGAFQGKPERPLRRKRRQKK